MKNATPSTLPPWAANLVRGLAVLLVIVVLVGALIIAGVLVGAGVRWAWSVR